MAFGITFRLKKKAKLTHQELDDNFRYPFEWEPEETYKAKMVVFREDQFFRALSDVPKGQDPLVPAVPPAQAYWRSVGGGAYAFSGYSSRFGENFNVSSLKAALDQILSPYQPPQATLALSGPAAGTYEQGSAFGQVTLIATLTARSQPVRRVEFYRGADLVHQVEYAVPRTGNFSLAHVLAFAPALTSTASFTVRAIDAGGGSTTSVAAVIGFAHYRYWGLSATNYLAPALTDADLSAFVRGLAGREFATDGNFPVRTLAPAGQFIYLVHRASYGATLPPAQFLVNGQPDTGWLPREFSFTNAAGHSEQFVLWRSQQLLNNSFTVDKN